MISIKSLGDSLAEKLTDITRQKDAISKISYGFELIMSESCKAISLLVIAYFLDLLIPVALLILATIPLRITVGGGHCTSSFRCLISTIVIYLVMATLSVALTNILQAVYLLGFCLVSFFVFVFIVDRYGPGYSVNYPAPSSNIIENVKRKVFAIMTVYTIIILNAFYLAQEDIALLILASAAIGGLWQSLMITSYGQRLIVIFDKGLLFAKIK